MSEETAKEFERIKALPREERIEFEKTQRADWGRIKVISINSKKNRNFKPKEGIKIWREEGKRDDLFIELKAGYCPCATCNFEYMWECDDAQVECCSSICT